MTKPRRSTAVLAGCSILLSPMGLSIPQPAYAATSTDWSCQVRHDGPVPLVLKPADLAQPSTDRRMYDLDCSFTTLMPGPVPVTLCVSAPVSAGGRDLARILRRANGNETINYRLRAAAGSVPGAIPFPPPDLAPTVLPVYTLQLGGQAAGAGTIRHQFALLAELEPLPRRFLAEGEYGENIDGFAVSIHEGSDCGPLLWGPPNDSIGPAANYELSVRLPATCSIDAVEPIQFGVLEDFGRDQLKSGTIGVRCSPGASYLLELGDGTNPSNGTRRMTSDAQPGASNPVLAYDLLKPDGESWAGRNSAVAGEALGGVGTGVRETIAVTARIPAGPPPAPGTYRDAVIATLVY